MNNCCVCNGDTIHNPDKFGIVLCLTCLIRLNAVRYKVAMEKGVTTGSTRRSYTNNTGYHHREDVKGDER